MSKPIEYGRPWWEVMKEVADENARLKAEVERLEAFCTRTIIPNELLQAEIARLRKAGDNLERALTSRSGSYDYDSEMKADVEAGNASHEWQSAKNYKPSV